jgi:hypothetical protein
MHADSSNQKCTRTAAIENAGKRQQAWIQGCKRQAGMQADDRQAGRYLLKIKTEMYRTVLKGDLEAQNESKVQNQGHFKRTWSQKNFRSFLKGTKSL